MKKIAGIYKITNIVNNKVYIGQSVDIYARINRHFNYLKSNKHHNEHLQNSFNKYGEDVFFVNILKVCKIRYLDRFEKLYIRVYKSWDDNYGYNKDFGGNKNKIISKETRQKISNINNHNYLSFLRDECRQEIIDLRRNKYTCQDIGDIIGCSHETIRSLLKEWGYNNLLKRSVEQQKNIIISKHQKGLSCRQIAKDLDLSHMGVINALKKWGYQTNKKKPIDAYKQEMIIMRQNNKTYKEIAKYYGYAESSIAQAFQRWNK